MRDNLVAKGGKPVALRPGQRRDRTSIRLRIAQPRARVPDQRQTNFLPQRRQSHGRQGPRPGGVRVRMAMAEGHEEHRGQQACPALQEWLPRNTVAVLQPMP